MDFEFGRFSFWECATGTVSLISGENTIAWSGTGENPNQHAIVSSIGAGAGFDAYGRFPRNCPNGSGYSVQLGNNSPGRGAEKISYTYAIPSTAAYFSVLFHYAVVLQNPDHSIEEQPRFRATIIDITSGMNVPCATFDFAASGGLPGFRVSPINPTVIYKDWTPVTVNLTSLIGRTIRIEFTTSDCTQGAHFGYAYIDVNSNCNNAIGGATICQGDNRINLVAPYGFQGYEWYADPSFSSLIARSQNLSLSPAPLIGTVYPVIVTPYPGYGCVDTLYATITVSPKPRSAAGRDTSICKYASVQIGGPPTTGLQYTWSPPSLLNNPIISDPLFTAGNLMSPQEIIVRTTDVITGCFSHDTIVISPIPVDTAIRLTGNAAFCDQRTEALLSVNNSATSIQWYNSTTLLAGANSTGYQPTVSGAYWAQLTENGCTDTTAAIQIAVHPLPRASFIVNSDTLCETNNSFLFTNTSRVSDNTSMTHNWRFSDGSSMQTTDATKNFPLVGAYDARLVITTAFGCKDSTTGTVYVLPNGTPDFVWDSACMSRPVLFTNRSDENGSASVRYSWNFSNGGPSSQVKDPAPVTYTTSGMVNVSLQMTTLGCETDPKTVTKQLSVYKPAQPVRYKDITVPQGEIWSIHARDTVGNVYSWRPQVHLNNYNSSSVEFNATGNDVLYLIDIRAGNTCVTTDTLLMQVLKKTGHYLPTAFTPNGDGLNDLAIPYLVGMKSLKSFAIFNRWGNRVFYTETHRQGWDGKYKGQDQPTGVFVWILQYFDLDNKLITARGTITVIR